MTANQNQAGLKSDLIGFLVALFLAAPSAAQGQDYQYTITNSAVTITRYTGDGGAVTIPSTIDGLPVTTIGNQAFMDRTNVTSITIPDSVTSVEIRAFAYCTGLTHISIGKAVTNISYGAFSGCGKLTQVIIPDNVLSLDIAFNECAGLTNIVIGNGLTTITGRPWGTFGGWICPPETGTFSRCSNLTRVTIGKGARHIQCEAFAECDKLTNVAIPRNVAVVENGAFARCTNLAGVWFEGDAPAVIDRSGSLYLGTSVFADSPNVVVYYLPDRTGWGPTFSKRRTALWNPHFQTTNPAIGGHADGFGLPISGTADIPIVLEASIDFSGPAWVPLLSCTLTNGSLELRDPEWAAYPNRFYRIRSP